jgi:putative transposase
MQVGGVYHVIPRFVAREWFIPSALERRVYLSLLGKALVRTSWRCFAFAVMSNHIHLALVAGAEPLKAWLRPMHTEFALWINRRRERIGAVIVRGPNVIEVVPDGAGMLVSYIHCNPVRAGVVARATESDWTSHRLYAGMTPPRSWLDVGLGLELAGFGDRATMVDWVESVRADRSDLEAICKAPPSHQVPG